MIASFVPDVWNAAPASADPQWLNNDDNATKENFPGCAVAVGMCSWYPLASYVAPAAVANAALAFSRIAPRPRLRRSWWASRRRPSPNRPPGALAENVPQREVKLSAGYRPRRRPAASRCAAHGLDASVDRAAQRRAGRQRAAQRNTPHRPRCRPQQPQLKVYLNDEPMGACPVTSIQLGKDPRAAAD